MRKTPLLEDAILKWTGLAEPFQARYGAHASQWPITNARHVLNNVFLRVMKLDKNGSYHAKWPTLQIE